MIFSQTLNTYQIYLWVCYQDTTVNDAIIPGYHVQIKNQLFVQNVKVLIGTRRERMIWKTNIDSIRIICKKCNGEMVLESNWNNWSGIYVCTRCEEQINLRVNV